MNQDEPAVVPASAEPVAQPAVAPPYPPPPPIPPAGFAPPFAQRRERPWLGRASWIGGALLWAYVVLGQLVVHLGFPEPLAVLVLIAAGFQTVRHATSSAPRQRIAAGLLGVGFFVATVLLSMLFLGSSSRDDAELATLFLLVAGIVSHFGGRRTAPPATPESGLPRPARVIAWVVVVAASLLTLASALAEL